MRLHRILTRVTAWVPVFSSVITFAADKPKVFVAGENSFHVRSSRGEVSVSGVANATAAEGIKLFRTECPSVEVTMRHDKADYIVGVTDDGSGVGRKGRRVVVSTLEGTVVFANSTRRLKNAIKDACKEIAKEWRTKARSGAATDGGSGNTAQGNVGPGHD